MFYSVLKTACLLLYFVEFVSVVHSTAVNNKQSIANNAKLTSTDRERRDAVVDDFEDDLDKRSGELIGKGSPSNDEGLDNQMIAKRYLPYEELEKRLRHFIGKRTNDDESFEKRRGRYFVGKREGDDENFAADKRGRNRFFLGKREDDDETAEKRRGRFFLGKRRYFLGKREDLENDLEKRAGRFFLGKRRRFFLGKRGDYLGLTPADLTEGDVYPDVAQSGLRDFVQKRMRYFVGKREDSDAGLSDNMETDKRYGRYFVGK